MVNREKIDRLEFFFQVKKISVRSVIHSTNNPRNLIFTCIVNTDENLFRCRECCYIDCSKSKVLNEKIILK